MRNYLELGRRVTDVIVGDDGVTLKYGSRGTEHPVGQSLLARHRMALDLYRPGEGNADRAVAIMACWIAAT